MNSYYRQLTPNTAKALAFAEVHGRTEPLHFNSVSSVDEMINNWIFVVGNRLVAGSEIILGCQHLRIDFVFVFVVNDIEEVRVQENLPHKITHGADELPGSRLFLQQPLL